jgi:hypothetical protein
MAVDFARNAAHEQDDLESVKTSDWENAQVDTDQRGIT